MKMVLSRTLNVGLPKIFRFILNMNNQDCTMLIISYKDGLKWLNYFGLLIDKLIFARSNSLYTKIDIVHHLVQILSKKLSYAIIERQIWKQRDKISC